MKSLFTIFIVFIAVSTVQGQLPNRVKKLEGLWEYRAGSGFERWELKGDVMHGESFRINKLGDTIVAERFEISYVNKRLVLHLQAYHVQGDSMIVHEKVLIGKRRKMEFSNVSGSKLEKIRFKYGCFTRKRLKMFVYHKGIDDPQKLRLARRD